MNNKIILGAGLLSMGVIAWAAKDPVVMTVNGVDVPKSEFEYLYHKNSQQQLNAQPLDEYVEMFKLYKLKVADARAAGIDTTANFLSEMAQYRSELAAPYLADSVYINSLALESYERSKEEVQANHIMLRKGHTPAQDADIRHRIDSIRQLLLDGGNFEELATRYSEDPSVATNKGHLPFTTANRFPYAFETAAYNLKPGEISKVVESPVGYHVLVGGEHRPARGTVLAAHIMKMCRPGASEAVEANAKAEIDSIYNLVKENPDQFESVARRLSDDTGSARAGGRLPWFGPGQMVPEFEEAAYALGTGEISEPIRSQYGWHIIMKIDSKGVPSLAEQKPEFLQRIASPRDERYELVKKNQTAKLSKKHKLKINEAPLDALRRNVSVAGLDSTFYATYEVATPEGSAVIATVDGNPATAADFVKTLRNAPVPDTAMAAKVIETMLDNFYNKILVEAEEEALVEREPEYRNLLNEYRDGSLLYEISVRKVWDKAAKDEEGLTAFFNANKADYTWTEPKAKGLLVQVKNDSIGNLLKQRYLELGGDTAVQTLRKEFRNDAIIDRVLASKGTNKMVDNLMFNGPETTPGNSAYTSFFMLSPRLLTAPEEMSDVRGQVTSDYQAQLEKQWVEKLKTLYPVVVYDKVLKKVK